MIFTGKIINKQCTYSNSLINTRHDVEQAYSYSTKLFRGPDTTASPLWYEYGTTFKFYLTTIAKVLPCPSCPMKAGNHSNTCIVFKLQLMLA